jgi:hypothetical protein
VFATCCKNKRTMSDEATRSTANNAMGGHSGLRAANSLAHQPACPHTKTTTMLYSKLPLPRVRLPALNSSTNLPAS